MTAIVGMALKQRPIPKPTKLELPQAQPMGLLGTKSVSDGVCMRMHEYVCMYIHMEVHVHSTLAFRKQKEKRGKVTHTTIAQTNRRI